MSRRLLFLGAVGALLLPSGCGKTTPKTSSAARSPSRTATLPPGATSGPTATAGATNVVLPATFTLGAGGAPSPPTVSAPKGVPVLLTVVSSDTHNHQVELKIGPHARTLAVPAHGHASERLPAPAPGTYPIAVDGATRAHLIVGVAPGP